MDGTVGETRVPVLGKENLAMRMWGMREKRVMGRGGEGNVLLVTALRLPTTLASRLKLHCLVVRLVPHGSCRLPTTLASGLELHC